MTDRLPANWKADLCEIPDLVSALRDLVNQIPPAVSRLTGSWRPRLARPSPRGGWRRNCSTPILPPAFPRIVSCCETEIWAAITPETLPTNFNDYKEKE